MRIHWQYLAFLLLIIACCSCSSGSGDGSSSPAPDGLAALSPAGKQTAAIEILPGGLFDSLDAGSLSIVWSEQDGQPLATISTNDTVNLRAAYLRISVPGTATGSATVTPGSWAGEDALSIAVPSADNTLDIGVCMLHPDSAGGHSGPATLARLRFADEEADELRTSSAPPLSAGSRIDLDYDPSRNFFYWYYANQGDYDQNGEVNVSDLTPIAVHFGKTASGGFPRASVESVVDGDDNGEINIADISPIGIGFGSRVEGFNLYKGQPADYPGAADQPSTIAVLQTTVLADALNTPAQGRLYYEVHSDAAADAAAAYWLRPAEGAAEGIPSDLSGLGNQAPSASFTLEASAGLDPFQLKADASASSDPEGGALEYYWYIVDGIFAAELTDPGNVTLTQQVGPGNWSVALYVRDEHGATGFAARQFSVAANAGWQITDLDIAVPGAPVMDIKDIALAGIDGRPYIASVYQSTSESVVALNYGNDPLWNQPLAFRRINELMGGNAGQVEILDVGGVPGVLSLQKKPTESRVEYNYVEDQQFTSPYNIALSNHNLRDISAVMADGRPSVAIFDRDASELLYAISDDATGSHWGTAGMIDSGANLGWYVSAGVVSSSPALVYWDAQNKQVIYKDSHIASGNVVWHVAFPVYNPTQIEIGDAVLDLPAGGQWLLLHDYTANGLVNLRDNGFATKEQLSATAGDSHTEYSVKVIGERVCYVFVDSGKLKFRRSTDGTGATWLPVQEITDLTTEDGWVSLADVGGFPAVAYVDDLTATAHYAVLVE
ncbi:MAG: hypothetical protein R3F46_05520 [bacterium]